ncbi:hypothetical protein B7494_g2762 [Chlorociboria aeruginascens]|nr:hypothetical protein B7494_g2762 [Chlorociboria aeruginascens]
MLPTGEGTRYWILTFMKDCIEKQYVSSTSMSGVTVLEVLSSVYKTTDTSTPSEIPRGTFLNSGATLSPVATNSSLANPQQSQATSSSSANPQQSQATSSATSSLERPEFYPAGYPMGISDLLSPFMILGVDRGTGTSLAPPELAKSGTIDIRPTDSRAASLEETGPTWTLTKTAKEEIQQSAVLKAFLANVTTIKPKEVASTVAVGSKDEGRSDSSNAPIEKDNLSRALIYKSTPNTWIIYICAISPMADHFDSFRGLLQRVKEIRISTVDMCLRDNPNEPQGTPNQPLDRKERGRPTEQQPKMAPATLASSQTYTILRFEVQKPKTIPVVEDENKVVIIEPKRKRGRPAKSKNKPKDKAAQDDTKIKDRTQ